MDVRVVAWTPGSASVAVEVGREACVAVDFLRSRMNENIPPPLSFLPLASALVLLDLVLDSGSVESLSGSRDPMLTRGGRVSLLGREDVVVVVWEDMDRGDVGRADKGEMGRWEDEEAAVGDDGRGLLRRLFGFGRGLSMAPSGVRFGTTGESFVENAEGSERVVAGESVRGGGMWGFSVSDELEFRLCLLAEDLGGGLGTPRGRLSSSSSSLLDVFLSNDGRSVGRCGFEEEPEPDPGEPIRDIALRADAK